MLETKKLLSSTKNKITKYKNDKNVSHLEITEVVLIHCNIVTTIISKIQESYIHLFLINHFVNYQIFHQKKQLHFQNLLLEDFHILKVCFTCQNSKPLEMEDKINII